MIDEKKLIDELKQSGMIINNDYGNAMVDLIENQPKFNRWISCNERLPKPEKEVLILTYNEVITTALYEDGTIYEQDSCWTWNGFNFEYDEERDDYIISEGWWEWRHFNEDDVLNNKVYKEVIAWHPLPEGYKPVTQ